MDKRLVFLPGDQEGFLLEVTKKSKLSVDALAMLAGVSARSYRDWRRGKLNMSFKAAEIFGEKFGVALPESKNVLVSRWLKIKREANRKGGLARHQKYGNFGTLEGRKKGGKRGMRTLKKLGILPPAKEFNLPAGYNSDLAECVGIFLGDGGLTQYQAHITLNRVADRDYLPFVISLGERLFGEKPGVIERERYNTFVLYYSGVSLIKYLTKVGLKIGNKIKHQVGVPEWVKSNKHYRLACLRGLMDTDGGVFLHRYKVNGKLYVYKKICFSNRSLPLIFFTERVLREDLGLNPKIFKKMETKRVWLYNKDEARRYLEVVGTNNPRLLRHES